METNFNHLLLQTAFAVMACDGEIAIEELELIRDYAKNQTVFGDIDIDAELNLLVEKINQNGKRYLKEFLSSIAATDFTEDQELNILSVAAKIINVDKKVEYSEIKFFKLLRQNLKHVNDDIILAKVDGVDENTLAQDIRADYLQTYDDYFNTVELPKFTFGPGKGKTERN